MCVVMPAAPADLCRVLIVEDDPDSREVMALLFGARDDREVHVAGSVGEALGEMRKRMPSHILLDLMLPDYGGVVLLRAVREDELPVRVALVTAAGPGSQSVEEAMRWRPDAVFYKPVNFDAVARWLSGE